MWIHILILIFFCALFFYLRGFFSKAGKFLSGKLPDFIQVTPKQLKGCLLIVFFANLTGLSVSFFSYVQNDTIKEGYLVRNTKGGEAYEETLMVSDGESTQSLSVQIDAVAYTKEELEAFLEDALAVMDQRILGKNKSLEQVEYPLNLMTGLEDMPVTIEWNTDQPEYLDWEGAIGESVPKSGVNVLLKGELMAGEYLRVYERMVTVYPEKLPKEEAFGRDIQEQLKIRNEHAEAYFWLPQELNGKTLFWHKQYANDGWMITALGILAGILWIVSEKNRKKDAEKRKKQQLKREYPQVLNKLLLYMSAGVSSRMAVKRMVLEYQQHMKDAGKKEEKSAAYEELCRMYYEMEQGISEEQAYERLAVRSGLLEYRTLSNLMAQHLKKGSSQFLKALEEECRLAFEERKRSALIAGEEAGTKLLIPMVLMLVIVLLIIMVPSFLVF